MLSSAGAAVALLFGLAGTLRFWDSQGAILNDHRTLVVVLVLALLGGGIVRSRPNYLAACSNPWGWLLGLLGVFLSDWMGHPYGLFPGPAIRGEILLGAIACYFSIRYSKTIWLSLGLVSIILLLFTGFLQTIGSEIIFSDDHAAVFYRLQLLKENFPFIPFYNPQWNAGTDARDFFATGVLNLFLLTYPLLRIFDLSSVYTLIVAIAVFGFLPLTLYLGARIAHLDRSAALISAFLGLTATALWYRWGLSYGSMGFVPTVAVGMPRPTVESAG